MTKPKANVQTWKVTFEVTTVDPREFPRQFQTDAADVAWVVRRAMKGAPVEKVGPVTVTPKRRTR